MSKKQVVAAPSGGTRKYRVRDGFHPLLPSGAVAAPGSVVSFTEDEYARYANMIEDADADAEEAVVEPVVVDVFEDAAAAADTDAAAAADTDAAAADAAE